MEEKKVSKAQQRAVNKYVKNNYDRILLTVPKGEKEVIQRAASAAGVSLNAYIRGAVSDRIQREQGNAPAASDNAPESLWQPF